MNQLNLRNFIDITGTGTYYINRFLKQTSHASICKTTVNLTNLVTGMKTA